MKDATFNSHPASSCLESIRLVGQGWLTADKVAPGDAIRNADLRELTVLVVEVDGRPQLVHNLETAEAHTYFAGEMEAWGHNRKLLQRLTTICTVGFSAITGHNISTGQSGFVNVLGGELDLDPIPGNDTRKTRRQEN